MQIAVTPNASTWIVVPEFPPPGWERVEARRRASGPVGIDPRRRARLEELLTTLRRIERFSPLARLLHAGDETGGVFAVDVSLALAHDDGSKAGRHTTQRALLEDRLPGIEPRRLRPSPTTAGFWALAEGDEVGSTQHPAAVVVLRKAGLPTVPVDIVMSAWGASPQLIAPMIDEVIALADGVAPADLPDTPMPGNGPAPVQTAATP